MAGIRRVSDLGTKGWSNILDGSIVTADLANSAVTTAKIADNNITQAKLASNISGITTTTSTLLATAVPSPFQGQYIYETDTGKTKFWNGTIWKEIVLTNIGAASQYPATTVNPFDVGNNWYRYGPLPEVTMETGTSVCVSFQLICAANATGKTVQIVPSVSGATTINGLDGNASASVYLNSTGVHSASWSRVFSVNAGVNEFYLSLIGDGGSYALTFRASMVVFRLN